MHLGRIGGRSRGYELAILLVGMWLLAGSCSDDSSTNPPTVPVVTLTPAATESPGQPGTSSPGPGPLEEGPLEVGVYRTGLLTPSLRIAIADDAWFFQGQTEDAVYPPGTGRWLLFEWAAGGFNEIHPQAVQILMPKVVLDPSKPFDDSPINAERRNAISVPDDVYSLFATSPHLEVLAEEEQQTLWGLSGKSFDALIVSAPEGSPVYNEFEGAAWHITGSLYLAVGTKVRWIMLDFENDVIHIIVEASPDDFDRFLPIVQRFLDGIEILDS